MPLFAVVQPADRAHDGQVDGVIEVLLPATKLDSALLTNLTRLRLGAGLLVALVGWALMLMRRRLRLRLYTAEHDPLTGLGNRRAPGTPQG